MMVGEYENNRKRPKHGFLAVAVWFLSVNYNNFMPSSHVEAPFRDVTSVALTNSSF